MQPGERWLKVVGVARPEGGSSRASGGRRDRASGDRGAVLIEFAIITPLLFLLLFGVVEFGKGFNDYQSIRQGVREGARAASVDFYRTAPATCGDGAYPTSVRRLMCLTKSETNLGDQVRVRVIYTAPVGETDPTDRGAVKVCAQRNFDPITGFIPGLDGIVLKSKIEMRMEKSIPDGIAPGTAYTDAAPSGGDWSWC
jgi:hypothetical protein